MSHKFGGNVLAECAYVIAGHGFTEGEYGSSSEGPSWDGLIYVSAVVLRNVGEDALALEFEHYYKEWAGRGVVVWLREYSDGSVYVIDSAAEESAASLFRRFDAAEIEYNGWEW